MTFMEHLPHPRHSASPLGGNLTAYTFLCSIYIYFLIFGSNILKFHFIYFWPHQHTWELSSLARN